MSETSGLLDEIVSTAIKESPARIVILSERSFSKLRHGNEAARISTCTERRRD